MRKGDAIECPACASLRRYCIKNGIEMHSKPICPSCYDDSLKARLYEGNRQYLKNKWTKNEGLKARNKK